MLGRGGADEHVEVVVAERAGAGQVHVVVAGVVALVASSGGLADVAIRHCRAKHDFTQEGRINEIAGLAHCTLASEETSSAVGNGHRAAEAGEVGHVEELAHGTGRTAGHLRAVQALLLSRAGVDEQVETVVT